MSDPGRAGVAQAADEIEAAKGIAAAGPPSVTSATDEAIVLSTLPPRTPGLTSSATASEIGSTPERSAIVPFRRRPSGNLSSRASVASSGGGRAVRAPAVDQVTCNICAESFGKRSRAGVHKGGNWFRCHACHRAVSRLELAAADDVSGEKKLALDTLKKDKNALQKEVLRLRATHEKNTTQKADCSQLLERLVSKNFVRFREGSVLWTKAIFVREMMRKGMSEKAADEEFTKNRNLEGNHSITHNGQDAFVEPAPAAVEHMRDIGWERGVHHAQRALRSSQDSARAIDRVRDLTALDAVAEASFASVGSRLLRPFGALPEVDCANTMPLPLRSRGDDDLLASQEDPPEEERSRSRTPTSAARLFHKQQAIGNLDVQLRNVKKLEKQVQAQHDDKRYGVLEPNDKEILALPQLLSEVDVFIGEAESSRTTLERAGAAGWDAAFELVRTRTATAQGLCDRCTDAIASAKATFKGATKKARQERACAARKTREEGLNVAQNFEHLLPPSVRQLLGGSLGPSNKCTIATFSSEQESAYNMPLMWKAASEVTTFKDMVADPVMKDAREVVERSWELLRRSPDSPGYALPLFWPGQDAAATAEPGWWKPLQRALKFPETLNPDLPAQSLSPWLLPIRFEDCVSGPQNVPLLGLGSILCSHVGCCWALLARSSMVDQTEGFFIEQIYNVRPTEVAKAVGHGAIQYGLMVQGDVLWVPPGWTGIFVACAPASNPQPTAEAAYGTQVITFPLIHGRGFEPDELEIPLNHAMAGIANNLQDTAWMDLRAVEKYLAEMGLSGRAFDLTQSSNADVGTQPAAAANP